MTSSPLSALMGTLASHTHTTVVLCAPYLNAYAQPALLAPALLWVTGAGRHERDTLDMLGWCGAAGGQRLAHRHFPGVLLGLHAGDVTTLLALAPIPEDRLAIDHTGAVHDQRAVVTRQLGAPDGALWTGALPRVVSRYDLDRTAPPPAPLSGALRGPAHPAAQVLLTPQPPFMQDL